MIIELNSRDLRGVIVVCRFGRRYLACKPSDIAEDTLLGLPLTEFWSSTIFGEQFISNLHQWRNDFNVIENLFSYAADSKSLYLLQSQQDMIDIIALELQQRQLLVYPLDLPEPLFNEKPIRKPLIESLILDYGTKLISDVIEDEVPKCIRNEFNITCGHVSRNFTLDLMSIKGDTESSRLSVVCDSTGFDTIHINQSGNCVHGKPDCPSIKISGPNLNKIEKSPDFTIDVKGPSSFIDSPSFSDFIGSLGGYESRQVYTLKGQGCSSNQPTAEIWAYDPYEWKGELSLGYNKDKPSGQKWGVSTTLEGKMGGSAFNFNKTLPKDTFTSFLNNIDKLIDQIQDFGASSGHGYKTLSGGLIPTKISVEGALKLAERSSNPDVALQGDLAFKFLPLIGFDVTLDVITAVVKRVFPGRLADPILEARASAEKSERSVKAKVKIDLTLDGRLDVTTGWTFKPDGTCLPVKPEDASKTELGITLTLKAITTAEADVFMVKFQIGAELSVQSSIEGTSYGVGVLFTAYSTVIENKPSLAGKGEFTGLKIIYSYHMSVMVGGTSSGEEEDRRSRNTEMADSEAVTKKSVTGSKVLLDPITFFDSGQSEKGELLSNVKF